MANLRDLLPRFQRDPAKMTPDPFEPRPDAYACATCMDAGCVVVTQTPELLISEMMTPPFGPLRAQRFFNGRELADTEVLRICPECPPDTQRARNLAGSMAPEDVRECRIALYRPKTQSEIDASNLVWGWALRVDRRPFLILVGETGTGKTHLAKAAILHRVEHGERARWQTADEILEAIKRSYDGIFWSTDGTPNEAAARAVWEQCGLLAIDDLGAGYATEHGRRVIESVIMARFEHRLPTVITSNLTLADLAEHQADGIGRLVSRLADARRTIYVEVEGPDFRDGGSDA